MGCFHFLYWEVNPCTCHARSVDDRFDSRLFSVSFKRIIRYIVYLAKGDLARLTSGIERAKYDWRDVIIWAEWKLWSKRAGNYD
jgi:hypothetical protein